MTRLTLLSTSDTDLLSARASGADWVVGNPSRLDLTGDAPDALPALLADSQLVIVRILGSARSWQEGLDRVLAHGVPVVVLGGEQTPDGELMGYSTVPVGTAAEAHRYLAYGGPENVAHLHAFLSDTVLLGGDGFEPPAALPEWGLAPRPAPVDPDLPRVGVLFYRAHHTSGNVQFAQDLADAVDATGRAQAVVIHCASLRGAPDDLLAALGTLDALVVTVLAAGGTTPATVGAGGDDEAWDVAALAALDIPILQALCLTWSRDSWAESDDGVSPLDSATQIAVPEFDGRIITVPFSFKEFDADGLPRYVTDPERCRRVAGIAVAHARLRHVPPAQRRIAIMLSAWTSPTTRKPGTP